MNPNLHKFFILYVQGFTSIQM